MAKIEYKAGQFFRFKDDHTRVYCVSNYDKSDNTVRGTNPVSGDVGWTKGEKVELCDPGVRVMSIKKGKHNPAFKPEAQAAKLRKAMAKVAELEEFKKFL